MDLDDTSMVTTFWVLKFQHPPQQGKYLGFRQADSSQNNAGLFGRFWQDDFTEVCTGQLFQPGTLEAKLLPYDGGLTTDRVLECNLRYVHVGLVF